MSSPEFYRTVEFYPLVDDNACVRCFECVRSCGLGVLVISGDHPENVHIGARKKVCRNCRSCVEVCRYNAIRIVAKMGESFAGFLKRDRREQGGYDD